MNFNGLSKPWIIDCLLGVPSLIAASVPFITLTIPFRSSLSLAAYPFELSISLSAASDAFTASVYSGCWRSIFIGSQETSSVDVSGDWEPGTWGAPLSRVRLA